MILSVEIIGQINQKIVVSGVMKILVLFGKDVYIQRRLLFGVHFRQMESFFERGAGNAVTVNAERYQSMLSDFLSPQLSHTDVSGLYFQQNVTFLRSIFFQRVISRNADFNWPSRSCDLTLVDFFLWGFSKSRVYANKPQTVNDLKKHSSFNS